MATNNTQTKAEQPTYQSIYILKGCTGMKY